MRERCICLAGVALLCLGMLPMATVAASSVDELAIHEPASGTWFGFNLDWNTSSAKQVNDRLGFPAASYVDFFPFPISSEARPLLGRFLDQVGELKGIAVVTLEPTLPLSEIDDGLAHDLATELRGYNERGIRILVRFAHEMNGSWYPWSQQPSDYVAAFRRISNAIHREAPLTGMLWAPNSGAGYPFAGGAFEIRSNHPDFRLLDTNGDGLITETDDPYAPYYPGDDAVDWVGMSLYHWGSTYPWGENEIPEIGKFIAMLTGTWHGGDGEPGAVPDFYGEYARDRGKPLAVVETAALYLPGAGGDEELAIKQAWWRQMLNSETLDRYPAIKMVNWFEWTKPETEVGNAIVDWTVTSAEPVLSVFRDDLPVEVLRFAPVFETGTWAWSGRYREAEAINIDRRRP